jgi:hypothetical protein
MCAHKKILLAAFEILRWSETSTFGTPRAGLGFLGTGVGVLTGRMPVLRR